MAEINNKQPKLLRYIDFIIPEYDQWNAPLYTRNINVNAGFVYLPKKN